MPALKATKAQIVKIQCYLRDAADILGLRDWSVTLCLEPTDCDDSLAEVNQTENQHGIIRLCAYFLTLTPEVQRATIAHELCHLKLAPIDTHVDSLEEVLDPQSYAIFKARYDLDNEHVVEAFARLVTPLLPNPDFGKPRTRTASAATARAKKKR